MQKDRRSKNIVALNKANEQLTKANNEANIIHDKQLILPGFDQKKC